MSELRKDDPVYYKVQLKKLLQQAVDNGLEVQIKENEVSFANNIGEKACVQIPIKRKEKNAVY